ncbi:uncharacterized protein BKCO1_6100069 [Diplodia corticola]|uniref:Uncharacterized protein n=1 Tax=Diplodia corticola TaxID=236234 RepID=A0A1J9RCX2_9PEZI|nr:uncharacterized protein BKCO1_6100069 [Diplodia corticola]OJD30363.1 hypothetical protein BKCO1_6100069 [Diplodia corticola]
MLSVLFGTKKNVKIEPRNGVTVETRNGQKAFVRRHNNKKKKPKSSSPTNSSSPSTSASTLSEHTSRSSDLPDYSDLECDKQGEGRVDPPVPVPLASNNPFKKGKGEERVL